MSKAFPRIFLGFPRKNGFLWDNRIFSFGDMVIPAGTGSLKVHTIDL